METREKPLNIIDSEAGSRTIFMVSFPKNKKSPLQAQVLSYISEAIELADSKYTCHVNSDEQWIEYGILRVLQKQDSGREFFQDMRMQSMGSLDIGRQDFQEGLKSKRRLRHLKSINSNYIQPRSQQAFKDKTGGFHELLDGFHIYAADGHFHAASTHEDRFENGQKYATGHLYAQNLRNRDLSHLALSNDGVRKKPHDMGTLKKMDIESLRQGAKKGQRVLYVYDRACIDFEAWMKWKHNSGIYFVTRTKSNMLKEVVGEINIDRTGDENSGVISDQYIAAGGAEAIRMITYYDVELDAEFEFITNTHASIPPGAIVQLYRMRWDIEKVFYEFKSKLKETKAWSKSLTGKEMQAHFMVLTYNLMLRLRGDIESLGGPVDPVTNKVQNGRWAETVRAYTEAKKQVPKWLEKFRRTTQIGVKFIRWLRGLYLSQCSLSQSLKLLEGEYRRK